MLFLFSNEVCNLEINKKDKQSKPALSVRDTSLT